MSIRNDLETLSLTGTIEVSDKSYMNGIAVLAKLMLIELDKKIKGWQLVTESATALGDELYPLVKNKIPENFKGQFSGGQVMSAAHLAYRAFMGD